MTAYNDIYPGHRISYDGALCTVRCKVNEIPGTKGEWLGIEWDDPLRGKHNGTHNGVKYFQCRSTQPTAASFVRPTRKRDSERTVLEAIRFKYVVDQSSDSYDPVVISGKVAEEVGFDKIIKAQSELVNLRILILDSLNICGVATRSSDQCFIRKAQEELASTCPNVAELDLSHNPIETWAEIEDICTALPNIRVLKLDVRFRNLVPRSQTAPQNIFPNVQELHLNECLLSPNDVVSILGHPNKSRFPALKSLWLSQNELFHLNLAELSSTPVFESIKTLMLENNLMKSLDPLVSMFNLFPCTSLVSLRSNKISSFGSDFSSSGRSYPTLISLNLSDNDISSFSFVDRLPQVLPNMSALRISGNPVYSIQKSGVPSSNRTDTSYYLTLARIPNLKSLNYTDITPREREEGEIYYLSVTEKDIRTALADVNTEERAASSLAKRYQRYSLLCTKYDRDNLITQLTNPTAASKVADHPDTNRPTYPPGSLASRLITSTFVLANSPPANSTSGTQTFTRPISGTIPTSSVFGLVSRELRLPALGFRLVYESEELDPAQDDMTTRSQLYAVGRKKGMERWDEWGDWDADAMVEMSIQKKKRAMQGESGIRNEVRTDGDGEEEGKWTDDGLLIKDGRKWKKREVNILFGARSWGDWFERGVKSCRVRVECVDRKSIL